MIKFTSDFSLSSIKNLHFVGIGGIGMSSIAVLLHSMGYKISGSDLKESEITKNLRGLGINVRYGHSERNLRNPDIVVVSSAVSEDNPEIKRALKEKTPLVQRAMMLAKIAEVRKTVTVAGTHGKTTTASMIASALESAGADATIVVGGIFKNISSNVKFGSGEYLVAEADESDGSFLHFSPLAACVTNIDSDHLDYYRNMRNLKSAFLKHILKVPFYGSAILCADDAGLSSIFRYVKVPFITYGIKNKADWQAGCIRMSPDGIRYTAVFRGKPVGAVTMTVGGAHNILNSLAALACGKYLGFEFDCLARGLRRFRGVKRRIENMGQAGGVLFLDDYGHHPTEISATLGTVSSMHKGRRIIAVFQPHRYTRTKILRREFAGAFKKAGMVYVMDIYPAGEKPIKGIDAGLLLNHMKKQGVPSMKFPGAMEVVRNLKKGDLVITIGAGDVWKTGEEIKLKLETIKGQ
ncbi:MAG: UDP-N-acetylmuramate--L-alanine ligase [Elusimicrobia bacterium]|nr:UDP-N-acetylmuramate--L-alanine ligase [Elusimicrobiota bacterium]